MLTYTYEEAQYIFNGDLLWLQDAGLINKKGDLTKFYDAFMQGKLQMSIHVEINVLRRIERLHELKGWLSYLRSEKAKFRT